MEKKDTAVRLDEDQLSVLCCQLALMLQAGIGVEDGVSMILTDVKDTRLRTALTRVHNVLEEGQHLSRALTDAGGFPDYMIHMVEIGQAAGRLEQVLSSLAAYYRREAELKQNLRRAVAYPAVMAILIAVVFLVLVGRVLPVFQRVFAQMGTSLSPVAHALLTLGSASRWIAAVAGVVLAALAAALLWMFRSQAGAAAFSRFFSRSAAGRAVDRSRFASAMSMMLSSGLPLDEAMERTRRLLEGSALSDSLKACQDRMDQGVPFAKAVEGAGLFTGLELGLLSAGSRAGLTDQAMEELAARCQEDASARLEQMLGRFEYALLIALCALVGLVLLSVMLPLLGALSALGG